MTISPRALPSPRLAPRASSAWRWARRVVTVGAASVSAAAALPRVTGAQPPPSTRPDALHNDTLWAQSLGTRKSLVVYLPPSYRTSPARRFPLFVYLHGLGGNERNWSEQGGIAIVLDSLARAGAGEAVVVMPDGDDGWYTTWNRLLDISVCRANTARREPAASFCVPWPHYDDYIANDVVRYADSHYRTRRGPQAHGIGGLSMGGYGAVSIALRYPATFAAAASHSGVLSPLLVAPKPYPAPSSAPPRASAGTTVPDAPVVPAYASDTAQFRRAAGGLFPSMSAAFGSDTIAWHSRDPARMIAALLRDRAPRNARPAGERTTPRAGVSAATIPSLYLDCGVDDPYLPQNRDLHAALERLAVSHVYAERPGTHDWRYWRGNVAHSLAFLLQRTGARHVTGP